MISLAQVFVSVVCFAALLQVSVGQSDTQCMQKMAQCIQVYTAAVGQRFGNINGLVELCSKQQEVVDCLKDIEGGEECMTAVNAIQASMEDLLDKSKVCDKKADIEKYSECFAKPEIATGCPSKSTGDPKNLCKELEADVMCFAKKVKEVCGEKQSEVMYFVSRAMARNIAKSQKKTCPGLGTSGVDRLVSVSVVFLGLFSLLVGALALI